VGLLRNGFGCVTIATGPDGQIWGYSGYKTSTFPDGVQRIYALGLSYARLDYRKLLKYMLLIAMASLAMSEIHGYSRAISLR